MHAYEFVFHDCPSTQAAVASVIGVRDLLLQDMISMGASMMGLGCSGKILPSPSPSSLPTRVREGGSYLFYYDFGASGMRGSIRLVLQVPTASVIRKVVVGEVQI